MKTTFFSLCIALASLFAAPARGSQPYPFSVNVSGTGSPVLFVPGFACSGHVWDETVARYSAAHTCHVLTMAGFAGEAAGADPEFTQWVAAIGQYLYDQRLKGVTIVGHSIGGMIAVALAADNADMVSSIVVVDAVPFLAALQDPAAKADPHADCAAMAAGMMAMDSARFAFGQQMTVSGMVAAREKQPEILKWSLQSDKNTIGRIFCQFGNTDFRDRLEKVACPSLILLEAPFTHLKAPIEGQYAGLKQANFQYATTGLHFIMYDDPTWFFAQLDTVLR